MSTPTNRTLPGPPERLRRLPTWLVNQLSLRTVRAIAERLDRPTARLDFAVLATLEEFGAMSQADLGRRLGLDRSDVAAVLDRLEDDALAQRSPDCADRRRNVISLTPEGSQLLEELERRFDEAQALFLSPLTARERAELTRLLQRLVDHHAGTTSGR